MENQHSLARRANSMGAVAAAIVGLLLVIGVLGSVVTVQAGYRGVKKRFGRVVGQALSPGLHFKIPGIETVEPMEVREQKLNLETSASSKDLQTVQSKIVVNFHPDPENVSELYNRLGVEYEERILDPAVEETVKAITAQYTAEQLISKRTEVRVKMEEALSERVKDNHIMITKFNIVNFEFSSSFNDAIERKQTEEQKALQAENELRRIEVEARQAVEEARGRADALRLRAQAEADAILMTAEAEAQAQEMLAKVIDRNVLNLRAIEKWDGVMPRVTGEVVPFIGVGGMDNTPPRASAPAAELAGPE